MDISREQWQPLVGATETGAHGRAPRAALMALAGLLCGAEPLALCASANDDGMVTSWQLTAVTERRLVVVEASRTVEGWELGHDPTGSAKAQVKGWTVPLSAVTKVTLLEVEDRTDRDFSPTAWSFTARYRIEAGEGAVTVPAAGTITHASIERVDQFIRQLLDRIS